MQETLESRRAFSRENINKSFSMLVSREAALKMIILLVEPICQEIYRVYTLKFLLRIICQAIFIANFNISDDFQDYFRFAQR